MPLPQKYRPFDITLKHHHSIWFESKLIWISLLTKTPQETCKKDKWKLPMIDNLISVLMKKTQRAGFIAEHSL